MQSATSEYEFPGIYQLLNLQNNKRYLGQAQNIANRIREHRRRRNGKSGTNRLYNAAKKYGWDVFQWSVVERVDDVSLLDEREKFWIDTLNVCDEEKGYNICTDPHTTRGWHHTTETKRLQSESASKRMGASNPFYGKKHSNKTKARIGDANRNRQRTAEEKEKLREARRTSGSGRPARPVCQINLTTGSVEKTWASASEAAHAIGIKSERISSVCLGYRGRKSAAGWGWQYQDQHQASL